MWLNQLFADNPIDFAKRCRARMKVGGGVALMGALSMGMVVLFGERMPVLYLEESFRDFMTGYYTTLGIALMAAGAGMILKNMRYLKNPELLRKREVEENDERNRLLGLRCWAYTGYAMFLILYVGVLVGGFISMTVLVVLQAVIGVYAVMLLIFKVLLSRCM